MIDALITAPDEATLAALLPQYRIPADAESPARWGHAMDRVDFIADVKMIRAEAVLDEAGEIITPADVVEGFTLCIRRRNRDPALEATGLPYLIADADKAGRGEAFVLATSYSADQIAGIVRVEPVWAGASYPFGG